MPALGRLHAPDERDRRFLLADAAPAVAYRESVLWPYFDKPLDQGETGTCVGHGWKHWLATAPVIQSDVTEPPFAFDIYDQATQVDEWTDNDHDYDRQYGTSVRAGAKVLQRLGYLSEYRWAFNVDGVANWLGGVDATGKRVGGPVVIGVNWYGSMFNTDAQGFLRISANASVAGGHCVCLIGWNERQGYAYGLNSWGPVWGRRGRFYLPGETLQRLLAEDGEAATALEVRLPEPSKLTQAQGLFVSESEPLINVGLQVN